MDIGMYVLIMVLIAISFFWLWNVIADNLEFGPCVRFLGDLLVILFLVFVGKYLYTKAEEIFPSATKVEYYDVEATITDVWFSPGHSRFFGYGRSADDYYVYVEYEDRTFCITDPFTYEDCKSKIGKTVKARLEVTYYDNGSIQYTDIQIE